MGRRNRTELFLKEDVSPDDLLDQLARDPVYQLTRFEVAVPSLNDIFISVAQPERKEREGQA